MKDAFMMSREEILAKTGTDSEKGLTPEQVEKSRSTYGTNSFVRQNHESLAKRIWDASTEPMLVMLIFAAIITLVVKTSPAISQVENTTSLSVSESLQPSHFR